MPATPACVPALPRSSCVSVLGLGQQAWASCPPSRPSPSSAAPTGRVTKAWKTWRCWVLGFRCCCVARASWPLGPPELKQVEQPHISSPGLFPFSIWHLLRGEEPETLESPSLRGPPSLTCEHKRPGALLRRRPSGPSSPRCPVPSPGLRSRCAFRLCRHPFLT